MFHDVSCARNWLWIVCHARSLVVWLSGLLFCLISSSFVTLLALWFWECHLYLPESESVLCWEFSRNLYSLPCSIVGSSAVWFCCSLLRLWPCSRSGSENLDCNSSKTKVFCAEYSAEIGHLWFREEWLDLFANHSRVWDCKVDCVRHCRCYKHSPCQASDLGIFRVMERVRSRCVRITDIPL